MAQSLSISIGNFLYRNCFPLYKLMYRSFKNRQDAYEISLMRQHIAPGDTVLDIGANIGFYASLLSGFTGPQGQVHCFEPDATNFRHLKARCESLPNVSIHHKAVADATKTLKIYTSKQLNVDHRTYKPDDYDQEIDIEAVAIDDYLQGKTVQFIKMDIQGFEMSAARGMSHTLQSPGLKVLSEFWPYGMRKAGSSILEYYRLLKQYGFHVYLIDHQSLKELTEDAVKGLMDRPESDYMNIFASKQRV